MNQFSDYNEFVSALNVKNSPTKIDLTEILYKSDQDFLNKLISVPDEPVKQFKALGNAAMVQSKATVARKTHHTKNTQ